MSFPTASDAGADDLKRLRRSDPVPDRLPPHSEEAEAGVLGCCLTSPADCMGDVREALGDARAFYNARNRFIFETLVEMEEARIAIDVLTLQEQLRKKQMLDQVGGIAFLAALQDVVPSAANLPTYLEIVREKFILRRWIALCTETVGKVADFQGDVDQLSDEISTEMFRLCEGDKKPTELSMKDVVLQVAEHYLDKFKRGCKHKIGPQTGFNYLDNILPGLGRQQLIVMAARPSTGKSAWMMQVAEHVTMREKIPAAIISLEMSAKSLGARELFQLAGSDMTKFLNGFMCEEDVQKLSLAGEKIAKAPLYIDDAPRMSIEELEIRARRMVRRYGIQVLFIDYFQLLFIRNQSRRQWSRSEELGECSKRLKALSRELNIAIVLLAQLNREIEKDIHRRPRLSDLKDTGQLEQDADVVMFLWKPNVSGDKAQKRLADIASRLTMVPEDWRTADNFKKDLCLVKCTVEKQREGRSGVDASMVFIKPWTRFVDAYTPPKEKKAEKPAEAAEPPDEAEEMP